MLPKNVFNFFHLTNDNGSPSLKSFKNKHTHKTISKTSYVIKYYTFQTTCMLISLYSFLFFILARKNCYKGWELEYRGYLMAGYYDYAGGSMYTCVDGNPDTLHGGHANKDGKLFYPVEARCGSLKCPPYVEGRELVCVVCSKK